MRPLRFLLTLVTFLSAFLLLIYVSPFQSRQHGDYEESSQVGAFFSWRTPSSLFPPSAIISLTDDNSTFFLARPAAFGPLLPGKSLSGQLWVGSGFDLDDHGRVGGVQGAEGELGCSDVPGWAGGDVYSGPRKASGDTTTADARNDGHNGKRKRSIDAEDEEEDGGGLEPDEDDGTDDHLHHPLPPSDGPSEGGSKTKKPAHADIQSLQESAEIAGKIVLLSRGGCGFLEKVKWVQRRGGVALIVGDDIRGGPLVTMYARGDTSNVTIPSLFTSHTTAHLLSSLIPSEGSVEDIAAEDAARLGFALGDSDGVRRKGVDKVGHATNTAAASKTTATRRVHKDEKNASPLRDREGSFEEIEEVEEVGWLRSIFGAPSPRSGDSRPPSSGNLQWIRQAEFEEDLPIDQEHGSTSTNAGRYGVKSAKQSLATDGFRIGVQDWRDPDLVAEQKEQIAQGSDSRTSSSSSVVAGSQSSGAAGKGKPNGGSITPSSGEYAVKKAGDLGLNMAKSDENGLKEWSGAHHTENTETSRGWLNRLFGPNSEDGDESHGSHGAHGKAPSDEARLSTNHYTESHPSVADGADEHEGLWVTLTPTSMSSSPFFDTLLVLVVSPLVTLTVVYALLLLRSRIRRRRWRAPKSVVERLPVRTYQTMPSTATTSSTTSSISSPVSATTPLLPSSQPQGARPIANARSRPRSRTASEVPQQGSSLRSEPSMASPSLEQIEEKRAAGLAEWRRRYGGKQRECVVCLEEYVDGVSRVMSLPCGHEFHEACITPWLTTRRRTCPICKGDVVRSLARNPSHSASTSPATHPAAPYRDDPEDEDEAQEQVALAHNDDPAAQQPVSREDEAFEDLERGVVDRNR